MSNTPTSSAQVAEGFNPEQRADFERLFATIHPSAQILAARLFERVIDDSRYCSLEVEYAWQVYRRTAATGADSLPPLPSYKMATTYDGSEMHDYALAAIAPYAERICHLERELATFKGEHATQLATKGIDTPEFRALITTLGPTLRHLGSEYQEVIAYIDGRTAGPAAPECYVIAPVEPTEEMIQAACLNQASLDIYPNYEAWWNSHSTGISEKIRGYVSSDYRVMIAAAPKPQEDA